MNFRRKIVWAVTSSLFILAVLFTVINLVDLNSQNASALPPGAVANQISIKIKVNTVYAPEPIKHEEVIEKTIEIAFENAIRNNIYLQKNLRVTSGQAEWRIYYLINQEPDGTTGMSITLSRNGNFVMNHIRAIRIDSATNIRPLVDDMIEKILNVIEQKMAHKGVNIIITDKSTISN